MILTNISHHGNLTSKVALLACIFHFNVSRGSYAERPAKTKQISFPFSLCNSLFSCFYCSNKRLLLYQVQRLEASSEREQDPASQKTLVYLALVLTDLTLHPAT